LTRHAESLKTFLVGGLTAPDVSTVNRDEGHHDRFLSRSPPFHGPPSSGNGGYTCGRLAAFIEGPATVRLKVPPPLETPMDVVRDGEVVRLMRGDQVVAEAKPASIDVDPPPPPSFERGKAAERDFPGWKKHYYPSCFVCGPERAEGDGLRIFPGPVPGRELVACGWIPDASLAGQGRGGPARVYLVGAGLSGRAQFFRGPSGGPSCWVNWP
jgi:hypothetical protein